MQARPSSRDPIGGVLFSRLHLKAGLEVVIEFSLIVGFCLPGGRKLMLGCCCTEHCTSESQALLP